MVVSWAPDATKFAWGEENGTVGVYNIETNHTVKMKGHNKWIMSLCW